MPKSSELKKILRKDSQQAFALVEYAHFSRRV